MHVLIIMMLHSRNHPNSGKGAIERVDYNDETISYNKIILNHWRTTAYKHKFYNDVWFFSATSAARK